MNSYQRSLNLVLHYSTKKITISQCTNTPTDIAFTVLIHETSQSQLFISLIIYNLSELVIFQLFSFLNKSRFLLYWFLKKIIQIELINKQFLLLKYLRLDIWYTCNTPSDLYICIRNVKSNIMIFTFFADTDTHSRSSSNPSP